MLTLVFTASVRKDVIMIEIQPRFVYTPNGVLEIQSDLSRASEEQLYKVAEALGVLSKYPGVTYEEVAGKSPSDILKVHIEVKNALGSRFGHKKPDEFNDFLVRVGHLVPILYSDSSQDNVLTLLGSSAAGFRSGIDEHFQRWLNTQTELDEQAAFETLQAMAVPFGREQEKAVKREFRVSGSIARAEQLGIAIHDKDFNFFNFDYSDLAKDRGKVSWNRFELTSVGKAGCDIDFRDDDEFISVGPDRSLGWLYEMWSGGVESSQQSLSLLLGMGAMAYRASQYSGQENILADAGWE